MPAKDPFKGGLELNFFPTSEFERLDEIDSSQHNSVIARNALRLLMMGWNESWQELFSWSTFKAVFIQRDPELLRELRLAFQQGFLNLLPQLQGQDLNKDQHEQVQLYLSNCLSLLPYSDLTPYESIKVPQFINNEWSLVEYNVVPIELTHRTGFSSWFIEDYDRVFAYGLEPLSNKHAKSHLIFMGTTYPAGQGFLPQVTTDLKGFETVGKTLYKSGRARIEEWLNKQRDKVEVCGMSLGGSLSLLLAIDQGDKLSRVDAMNPAGLHDAIKKSRYDHWDDIKSKPQVVVQQQGSDPVSPFGIWKKDWDIVRVNPPVERQGPLALCDHFLNYAGFAETQFDYIDAEEDNLTRSARNLWLYSIGRSILYYPGILPYNYVIRPIVNFIWDKKSYFIAGLLPLAILTGLFAIGLSLGILFAAAIIAGTLSLMSLAIVYSVKNPAENYDIEAPDHPKLHDPALSRNPDMDIYNPEQKVELNLTHKEVNTYFKMTRCLVKGKAFLPQEDSSKRDLLEATEDETKANDIISVKITKAKAVHIRHSLTLVSQLGSENASALKEALDENYQKYRKGKI